ncbi:hypothetical protein Gogos_012230 [Gossypium gossypioides]|uniref:Uncharacterized protein n=1 Tax=Gossypium gossypioides TaxID=34282 RepID=A0A7J9BRY2_GOSGO|nr:hypothetical protein [Gossypium gossypioides]
MAENNNQLQERNMQGLFTKTT